MKKKYLVTLFLVSLFMVKVDAVSSNASVGSNLTEHTCTAFQEESINITGDTYFGRCLQAQCNGSKFSLNYYSNDSVTCKNGNLNPYTKITSDGCDDYRNNSCSGYVRKYCTTITYFDCDRTSNGSKFTTTKKTTKAPKVTKTTETTTTTTTAIPKNNNTYLSSVTLSTGTIQFNKEVREYTINVEENITFITVNAKTEVETSKAVVTGNTNLGAGENKITITVTAEDGSVGTYIINVTKNEEKSKNAKLSSISIDGKPLEKFSSTITNYTYKTKQKTVTIDATTEDENAIYSLESSTSVTNGEVTVKKGAIARIVVTAEDGKTMQEYMITFDVPSGSGGIIIVFIIILLIVIGGGAFYFYTKHKNGGEKEYEYE